MLFRMIRGVLFHQRAKMLLIALTIALGASLATEIGRASCRERV